MSRNRYKFFLTGVNIKRVYRKYGIGSVSNISEEENNPVNTTRIEELSIYKKTPEMYSFLDEAKKTRKCTVSFVNRETGALLGKSNGKNIRCGWCRDFVPKGYEPIGCPIRYVPNCAEKTYYSEISKDCYTIREDISNNSVKDLRERKDQRFKVEKNDYYDSEGAFCSFNCVQAYIEENQSTNPLLENSETLLLHIYEKCFGHKIQNILAAEHWKIIDVNGGHKTIEKFREGFNKISSKYFGRISWKSIGELFEEKLRF